MRQFWKTLFVLICLLPAVAGAKLFDAEEFYLDNGLRVIVVPNHKAPVAKLMLWYRVGSIDEPVGKGGLAHLLEHLMFRGTKNVPDSDFNNIISRNGGDNNAFTSPDFTVYHEMMDISRLETAMALEADRMANLNFGQAAFNSERDIVKDERRQRVMTNPSSRFMEDFNKILWQHHNYARPVSGTEEEIESLTAEDVMAFYKRYYTPQNAVLVVSGDITRAEAEVLSRKYFGTIGAKSDYIADNKFFEPAYTWETRLAAPITNVTTPRVYLRYIVPTLNQYPQTAFALKMFESYLTDGEGAYLKQNLVLKEKAAGAGFSCDFLRREAGVCTIYAVPFPGRDVVQTEKDLRQVINQAIEDINQADLDKISRKIQAELVYIQDEPDEAAYIAGQMASLGMRLDEITGYDENFKSVTPDEVKANASFMMKEAVSAVGYLIPAETDTIKEEK